MTNEELLALKRRARSLYNDGPYGPRQILVLDKPNPVRHEDEILGGSGTWIDVSIFVPDESPTRTGGRR